MVTYIGVNIGSGNGLLPDNTKPLHEPMLTYHQSFVLWYLSKSNLTKMIIKPLWQHGPSLQWRHNGRDGVSNHQSHHCLLNRLFRCRSKKTSKVRVTGLCAGNSPVTGEFPTQMASDVENVSIWWRHHGMCVWRTSLHAGYKASYCVQGFMLRDGHQANVAT